MGEARKGTTYFLSQQKNWASLGKIFISTEVKSNKHNESQNKLSRVLREGTTKTWYYYECCVIFPA
jgi:hypothetical protein